MSQLRAFLLLPFLLFALASCDEAAQDSSTEEAVSDAPASSQEPMPTASQAPTPGSRDDRPTAESPFEFQGDEVSITRRMQSIEGTHRLPDSVGVPGTLNFEGGQYLGFPVDMWTFGFTRGEMWFAQLRYSTKATNLGPQDLMGRLHERITAKYGEPVAESQRRISRPLNDYTSAERQFLTKIAESYQGDFRIWPVGENRLEGLVVLTLNPGPDGIEFADVAMFDRDPTAHYTGAAAQ